MRRFAPLIVVVLIAGACGDDTTTTTAAAVSTAAASSTTTAVATTTAAVTTTAAATTTTVDAAAARLAAAHLLAGHYAGEWHNTTFGSTGSADLVIEVDDAAKTATVTTDLGGGVFGAGDPDPIVTVIDLTQEGIVEGATDLLGDYTVQIDADGAVTLLAPAVPQLGGSSLAVGGTFDPAAMSFTYTITQADGTVFAEGVMDVDRTG